MHEYALCLGTSVGLVCSSRASSDLARSLFIVFVLCCWGAVRLVVWFEVFEHFHTSLPLILPVLVVEQRQQWQQRQTCAYFFFPVYLNYFLIYVACSLTRGFMVREVQGGSAAIYQCWSLTLRLPQSRCCFRPSLVCLFSRSG